MPAPLGSPGANIKLLREAAGLSREKLSEMTRISVSHIKKIELGTRPALSDNVIAIADALNCTQADINGQVDMVERHEFAPQVGAIRRIAMLYDSPPDATVPPKPLDALAVDVGKLNRWRLDGNLRRMAMDVVEPLEELTRAKDLYTGSKRERALDLLVQAYATADQVVYRLGYDDLSNLIGFNIRRAALEAANPHLIALSKWMHAGSYLITPPGLYDAAFSVLDEGFGTLSAIDRPGDRELALLGSLHLKRALVASRAHLPHVVQDELARAREYAERVGEVPYFQLAFGPVNTSLYEVATWVEMGMGEQAVASAQKVVLPPSVPRERAAHHWLDTARGYVLRGDKGDHAAAVACLDKVHTIAPQQFQVHPSVKETLRVLFHTRKTDRLTQLAREAGLRNTAI